MSMPDRENWCCDVSVPGKSGAHAGILESMLFHMDQLEWSKKEQFNVQLAFEEAISNAIKHGNISDPNKIVRVACQVFPDHVTITIEDEGKGFDPEQVPDPRLPDNILIPSGRGILLIRHMMSRVEFAPSGNAITMIKYRDSQKNR